MQPCAAALVLAALVVSASGVSDETSLLQMTNDPAPGQSLDTPRLHCDLTGGCKYEGLPPRPEKPTPTFPSFLPGMDPAQLKKIMDSIKLPDMAQIQKAMSQVKFPDMAQVAQELSKFTPNGAPPPFQIPDFSKMNLTKIVQDASKLIPGAAAPNAPQVPQMPDFSKMLQDMSRLIPGAAAPKAPQMLGFSKTAEGLPASTSYLVPDNLMVCIQGSEAYLAKALAKLKASPLGDGYQKSKVTAGTCADLSYTSGPIPDKCLPQASLFMSTLHPLQPWSEPMLTAGYAVKHGMGAVMQGIADLCKE